VSHNHKPLFVTNKTKCETKTQRKPESWTNNHNE